MTEALLGPAEVDLVFRRLADHYPGRGPGAKGPKEQPDPFRSCVACMLSAQSLDRNTAAAADALFALATTPEEMLTLDEEALIAAIKPAGLYNNKAKAIRRFCAAVIERGGTIPRDREGLMSLPGIGRKCADIVMSFTFGEAVIAVDTHVNRVCNRTGLARGKTEAKTAEALAERAPEWALDEGHFWLIQHGKRTCIARAPDCPTCVVNDLCLWPEKRLAA